MGAQIKCALLCHYYRGDEFLGQSVRWVELNSERTFLALLNALTTGVRQLDGSAVIPRESKDFQEINKYLCEHMYSVRTVGSVSTALRIREGATSVRVMQILPWSAPKDMA